MTMTRTTNRRPALGAVLAIGATATTAVLPAAASEPQLSAVDRRVFDLWRRQRRVRDICDRLDAEWTTRDDQLPRWAAVGPVYLRPDGSDAGLPGAAGWPLVADLSRRPVFNGVVNARPSADDLYYEFVEAKKSGQHEAIHQFAQMIGELSDRLRQKDAERERLGVTECADRLGHAYEVLSDIEREITALVPVSVLALGASLVVKVALDDDDEEVLQTYRAALAAIRPQLVGAIAEDADRLLAQDGEVAHA